MPCPQWAALQCLPKFLGRLHAHAQYEKQQPYHADQTNSDGMELVCGEEELTKSVLKHFCYVLYLQ